MTSTSKIIQEVEKSFEEFIGYVNNFPSDKCKVMLVEKCKYKDVLAHIWEWENFILKNSVGRQN